MIPSDTRVPLTGLGALKRVVRGTAGARRFVTVLLSAFGALSLLLGAVGVYGVSAYAVRRASRSSACAWPWEPADATCSAPLWAAD